MNVVSVSIVSHGQAPLVERLLSSLFKHEQESRVHVLLTDNLGKDLDQFSHHSASSLTILRNPVPQGFARNHNQAFLHARGDFFCILNPDLIFITPVFEAMVNRIREGAVDVIAPLILDPEGRVQDSFRSVPAPLDLVLRRLFNYRRQPIPFVNGAHLYPDWIAGMFLFMRSDFYHQMRGLDERYHLYFEDVDFGCRVRLSGYTLSVDTGLKVIHDARRQSRRNIKHLLWHLQSAYRFFTSPTYRAVRAQRDKNA